MRMSKQSYIAMPLNASNLAGIIFVVYLIGVLCYGIIALAFLFTPYLIFLAVLIAVLIGLKRKSRKAMIISIVIQPLAFSAGLVGFEGRLLVATNYNPVLDMLHQFFLPSLLIVMFLIGRFYYHELRRNTKLRSKSKKR